MAKFLRLFFAFLGGFFLELFLMLVQLLFCFGAIFLGFYFLIHLKESSSSIQFLKILDTGNELINGIIIFYGFFVIFSFVGLMSFELLYNIFSKLKFYIINNSKNLSKPILSVFLFVLSSLLLSCNKKQNTFVESVLDPLEDRLAVYDSVELYPGSFSGWYYRSKEFQNHFQASSKTGFGITKSDLLNFEESKKYSFKREAVKYDKTNNFGKKVKISDNNYPHFKANSKEMKISIDSLNSEILRLMETFRIFPIGNGPEQPWEYMTFKVVTANDKFVSILFNFERGNPARIIIRSINYDLVSNKLISNADYVQILGYSTKNVETKIRNSFMHLAQYFSLNRSNKNENSEEFLFPNLSFILNNGNDFDGEDKYYNRYMVDFEEMVSAAAFYIESTQNRDKYLLFALEIPKKYKEDLEDSLTESYNYATTPGYYGFRIKE